MKTDGFYFRHTERNLEVGGLALVQQLDTIKAGISVIFLVFSLMVWDGCCSPSHRVQGSKKWGMGAAAVITIPLLGHFLLHTGVRASLLNHLVSFFYSYPSDDSSPTQSEARVLRKNSKASDVLVDQFSRKKVPQTESPDVECLLISMM